MPKIKRLPHRGVRTTSGAVPSAKLSFRLAAWVRRRLLSVGTLVERAGQRALDLSLFRAGEFLRHPLPRRVRVHPRLAGRTAGLILAALAHRISPALEERGILRALRRRRDAAGARVRGIARHPEQAMPVGIALLLVIAVAASLVPGAPVDSRINLTGDGAQAAAGSDDTIGAISPWGGIADIDAVAAATDVVDPNAAVDPTAVIGENAVGSTLQWRAVEPAAAADASLATTTDLGVGATFSTSGVLELPAAVDVNIQDGRDHLSIHVVAKGETLQAIASKNHLTLMELIWSNNLISLVRPTPGSRMRIPDTHGVVHVVGEHETLKSIASRAGVPMQRIIAYNHLASQNVVLGMVLVIPGGRGPALPTYQVLYKGRPISGTYAYAGPLPKVYSGMTFVWPVPRYITQPFHRGHEAIDIGSSYGHPIVAAAAGVVTQTGWANGGCGLHVYIAHGSNLYTGYCHMSAILVRPGQKVARGQVIGRVGLTGITTGPHVHFMVSRGQAFSYGSVFYDPERFLP
jgi:LysM repeat protein